MAPHKVASVAAALLVVVGIFRGGAAFDIDVAKLKIGATALLVDGTDTAMSAHKNNTPYLSSVDSIDRQLKIRLNLPASGDFPGAINNVDVGHTCNKTWQCNALNYEICPGMSVTTAMVRGWGAITAGTLSSQTLVKPTFSWDATASKYYTLIFVDFMNPDWAQPLPAYFGGIWGYHHWSVYNIVGNDVTTGTESGAYAPPGNWYPDKANHYTFLLFQHDDELSDATVVWAQANALAVPFADYLTGLGLQASQLVSINWWNAKGCAASLASAPLNFGAVAIPTNACAVLTGGAGAGAGPLDMCSETIDTTCNNYATASSTIVSKAPASWSMRHAGVLGLVVFAYLLQAQV